MKFGQEQSTVIGASLFYFSFWLGVALILNYDGAPKSVCYAALPPSLLFLIGGLNCILGTLPLSRSIDLIAPPMMLCIYFLDYVTWGQLHLSSLLILRTVVAAAMFPPKDQDDNLRRFRKALASFFLVFYHTVKNYYGEEAFFTLLNASSDKFTFSRATLGLSRSIAEVVIPCSFMWMGFNQSAYNYHAEETITDEKQLKEKAESESVSQTAFMEYLSHEIRNSLNVILASTEFYSSQNCLSVTPVTMQEIHSAASTAARLVSDVLTLDRAEQNKLPLEFGAFDVNEMIESVMKSSELTAKKKGLKILFNSSAGSEESGLRRRGGPFAGNNGESKCVGDMHRLKQILDNFMSNAVKFTPSGGTVQITWQLEKNAVIRKPNLLVVKVIDNGPGITKEDQNHLFKTFSQLRAGNMQAGGGSGLGLAICKKIANLHGGDVGVESVKGHGATFWVCVAVEKVEVHMQERHLQERHMQEGGQVAAEPRTLMPVEVRKFSKRIKEKMMAEAAKSPPAISTLQVLVVDDQQINVKMMKRALEQLGVLPRSITCAYDGAQAVEVISKNPNIDCKCEPGEASDDSGV